MYKYGLLATSDDDGNDAISSQSRSKPRPCSDKPMTRLGFYVYFVSSGLRPVYF